MDSTLILRIEKAFVCIFSVFILLFCGCLILDLFQFISNPSDYKIVYQKNINDHSWTRNYILQELVAIVSCILILCISVWRLVKPTKNIRLTIYLIYIILIIVGLIGYYKWYLTGYDH